MRVYRRKGAESREGTTYRSERLLQRKEGLRNGVGWNQLEKKREVQALLDEKKTRSTSPH